VLLLNFVKPESTNCVTMKFRTKTNTRSWTNSVLISRVTLHLYHHPRIAQWSMVVFTFLEQK